MEVCLEKTLRGTKDDGAYCFLLRRWYTKKTTHIISTVAAAVQTPTIDFVFQFHEFSPELGQVSL